MPLSEVHCRFNKITTRKLKENQLVLENENFIIFLKVYRKQNACERF